MELISKQEAIKEVKEFVEIFDCTKKDEIEIETSYPQAVQAVQDGLLIFDEKKKPTYQLKFPIKNESGEDSVSEIKFRTRIKPSDLVNISKGIDISKNQMKYLLQCNSYITGQPVLMFDKFEKFDLKVVEQICSVFL